MLTIHSLRSKVTRADAMERFAGGSIAGLLRRLRAGPLRSVADVYLPYRLYQVEVRNGKRSQTSWFALEAVRGLLDLYQFDGLPDAAELVAVETRNCPGPAIDDFAALQLLQDKLRRIIFQLGFFRVRNLEFRPTLISSELHIPYWVGFYGRGQAVQLRVLDAVRQKIEGAKARALLENWLVSS